MDTSPVPRASRWRALEHRLLLQTRVFDVRTTRFHHPVRNVERDFIVIEPPDWVNVIALTPDNQMVLVRQFRYGTDAFSLEIPGGVIEKGEPPEVAGVRELQEETGYVGSRMSTLGQVHPNPAIQSNRCHFILVEQATALKPVAWDHDEEIEVLLFPIDEVFALARSGQITHSLVLNALFLFEPIWREKMKAGTGRA